jgi:hypothetical protein
MATCLEEPIGSRQTGSVRSCYNWCDCVHNCYRHSKSQRTIYEPSDKADYLT